SALRKEGHSAEVTAALLTQARLRKEAPAKLGPFADDMLFTRDGLAQATRLPVAAHHARRLIGQAAPADTAEADGSAPAPDGEAPLRIADLGCGIGADSIAFSGMGAQVTAVDADEVTPPSPPSTSATYPMPRSNTPAPRTSTWPASTLCGSTRPAAPSARPTVADRLPASATPRPSPPHCPGSSTGPRRPRRPGSSSARPSTTRSFPTAPKHSGP